MVNQYFDKTMTIERYSTWTRGEAGQRIQTWSTHISVLGSFQQRSGNKSVIEMQDGFRKSEKFYCDIVDIVDTDRLVDPASTINVYEILTVKNLLDHHLEIDCDIVDKNSTKA